MKIFTLLAPALLALVACTQSANHPTASTDLPETECLLAKAISTDSLLTIAEGAVGDTIVVSGTVRHTCKHSGRKCFISNPKRTQQIRIMAGGNIGGFNKELVGSDIAVKGILRENRISRQDFDKAEQEYEALKAQGTTNIETCESVLSDIAAKRAYMDLNGRDYYSDFYVDGIDFVEL